LIIRSPITNWYYSLVAPWFLNSIELRLRETTALVQKLANSISLFMGMWGKLFSSCHLYFAKRNSRGEMSSPYKSEFTRWSTVFKFCHSKLESETHPSSIQKSGSSFLIFFLNCSYSLPDSLSFDLNIKNLSERINAPFPPMPTPRDGIEDSKHLTISVNSKWTSL